MSRDYLHVQVADEINCYREELIAEEIIEWVKNNGLPNDTYGGDHKIDFNPYSGCVYLANEDGQCWMMNGNNLETWYMCPECGNEGFREDILNYHKNCCVEHFEMAEEIKQKIKQKSIEEILS